MKQLKFNDTIATDLGIIVVEGASEVLAQEVYEAIEVEGRNGSLIVNKGYYKDLERTFLLTTVEHFEEDEIQEVVDKLKNWLLNVRVNKLYYVYQDRYNIVKKVIVGDIKTSLEEYGDVEVTFICEPFYHRDEPNILMSDDSMTLLQEGDFDAPPLIRIYGSGNITLTVNNTQLTINNVSGVVTIDGKTFEVFDGDRQNKTFDMVGDFPILKVGMNEISASGGNIGAVYITPRTMYR